MDAIKEILLTVLIAGIFWPIAYFVISIVYIATRYHLTLGKAFHHLYISGDDSVVIAETRFRLAELLEDIKKVETPYPATSLEFSSTLHEFEGTDFVQSFHSYPLTIPLRGLRKPLSSTARLESSSLNYVRIVDSVLFQPETKRKLRPVARRYRVLR